MNKSNSMASCWIFYLAETTVWTAFNQASCLEP